MKKAREIIQIPVDPEEEKIFHWVESDNCLGSEFLSENATTIDKIKYELCRSVVRYKRKKSLSLTEIVQKLNLSEKKTNQLLHYHLEIFSLKDLTDCVEKLHLPLQVRITTEESKLTSKNF